MKTCPDCGEQNLDYEDFCKKCGASLQRKVYSISPLPSEQIYLTVKPSYCLLSIILYVLAGLSLFGGIAGVIVLWPRYGGGYIPSFTALISGFISFILFCAIGKGLNYLHRIHEYIEALIYLQRSKHNN